MSHKTKRSVTSNVSSEDILGHTLSALDAIINDAQQQEKRKEDTIEEEEEEDTNMIGKKRRRGDVFAAMAAPHLLTLQRLIRLYGPQLTPAVDAIMRRVLLAIASPTVVSCACWELAAFIGIYFRAGAVRLLEELMELMMHEKSVFLLEASCLAETAGAATLRQRRRIRSENEEEINNNNNNNNEEDHTSAVMRNLRAFEELLVAVGPFLNPSILQRAALRFAQEVVISGILQAPVQDNAVGGSSSFDTSAAGHANHHKKKHNNNNNNNNNSRLQFEGGEEQQKNGKASVGISLSLQSICIDILTTFLLLCRPLPSVVSACAVRVVKEMPGRGFTLQSQKSQLQQEEQCEILRSINRLSLTLTALRHPHAVPFYLPPVDVVERATRRVVQEELIVINDTPINGNHIMEQQQDQQPQEEEPQPQEEEKEKEKENVHQLKPEKFTPIVDISLHHPPSIPSRPVSSLSTVETVHQERETQKKEETPVPVKPVLSTVSDNEDDDDDDIPDIDMED